MEPRLRRTMWMGPLLSIAALGTACDSAPGPASDPLAEELNRMAADAGAEVGIYYRHLARPDSVLVNPDLRMHAASTMKVPVMIELYAGAEAGRWRLDDSVMVTDTFRSIVDDSRYVLTGASDSEPDLYAQVGQRTTYRALAELMITVSSNLATNLLIEHVDAERVTERMRALGADSIQVLRGVEDIPAFEAGLSNTTTARDLGAILRALAEGRAGTPGATRDMIGTLERQQFREKIPAGLPPGVRVANKTGNITAVSHDAAIVAPESEEAYVLVVLTRGLAEEDASAQLIAGVAARVHERASSPR